jgi:hypothetical protein
MLEQNLGWREKYPAVSRKDNPDDDQAESNTLYGRSFTLGT